MLGFTRGEQIVLVVLVAAIIVGSAALIYVHGLQPPPEPLLVAAPANTGPGQAKVVVHVAGQVRSPGVYTLPLGARVRDAIQKAGGAKPGAALDALNLAQVLQDGEKLFVPSATAPEAISPAPAPAPGSPQPQSARRVVGPAEGKPRLAPNRKIAINSASAQELQALPGIGPAYAAQIVAYRERLRAANGKGFTSIEQLMEVPGIGPKRFQMLRAHVVL